MKNKLKLLEKFREVRPNLIYDRKVKKGVISGTDIGAIMGYNPYTTAYDVWLKRKFGFITPVDNSYIEAGLKLESVIARKYYMSGRTDSKISKGKNLKIKDSIFVGTPDFIIKRQIYICGARNPYDLSIVSITPKIIEEGYGLEVKTAHSNWLEVPTHYKVQCHWYMMLTGFKRWDLAVLIDGHQYKEYSLECDEEIEKEMVFQAMDFHHKYLENNEEPFDMLCQQKTKYIGYLNIDHLISHRNSHKKTIEVAEQLLKETETELKTLIGEGEGVKSDNYLITWKTQSRDTVDYKKIIEDHKIDIESYKKEGNSFRVLRVKEL